MTAGVPAVAQLRGSDVPLVVIIFVSASRSPAQILLGRHRTATTTYGNVSHQVSRGEEDNDQFLRCPAGRALFDLLLRHCSDTRINFPTVRQVVRGLEKTWREEISACHQHETVKNSIQNTEKSWSQWVVSFRCVVTDTLQTSRTEKGYNTSHAHGVHCTPVHSCTQL